MKQSVILWADDDPDDIAMIRDVLLEMDSSFQFVAVNNGQKALDHLQQHAQSDLFPSLIVLDMNMPILSGRDTLAVLKRNAAYKTIPTVVFTTSNNPMDAFFCQCYHVEMFTKPTSYVALKEVIAKLLRHHNMIPSPKLFS